MPSERLRILELALESLENKKKQIDEEIAALTGELRRGRAAKAVLSAGAAAPVVKKAIKARRRSRFSREERERRSARMKAYWDKWRKDKGRQK
ncbi:MAG: hypothetical protein LAP85_02240 [Acidobacteriia bacterium]|nr:hypothetical protein [Terriglobia bacterium]